MGSRGENLSITIIFLTLGFLLLAGFIVFFILIYRLRINKHIKEKLDLNTLFQQTLLQTQLEIQEQTFKNISQEIHDNIGQVLSLVKLNINTMDGEQSQTLNEKIQDSKLLITKAIQDLRDLSKSLNSDYVTEMGLMKSVEYELEMIQRTCSYEVQFNITGKPYRLEQQQELIFFRIVQEALHNIIKHAKATSIIVQIKFEPGVFVLKITDNGVGFDSSQLETNNYSGLGLGIRNMHNRASLINTNFKLISNFENGTEIVLTLPIQILKL